MVKKYRKKAMDGQFIVPYSTIAHVGVDSFYQVCVENKKANEQLIKFIEAFPKFTAMKSEKFHRYLLYLPKSSITELKRLFKQKEEGGTVAILWRNV
ncbi:MAG: hypothetical protein ACFFD4_34255, partial [Candidatus Odinarchaeota archaeon]